ncbi:TrkH family potassium uptake protein [Ilumatobacter sp.]|uniref:TrkH family potassium uptake protein n=1 Tax=Ilumatobacter sp. TaxID=1967498 RepID=UPI003B51D913
MIATALAKVVSTPARLVVIAFASLITLGTILLVLPVAVDAAGAVGVQDALFISTSASTVTGLATVDIAGFSLFGELVILGLIQVGGFGVMTIGSVLALVVLERVGLRQRMVAQAEIGLVDIGELSRLLWAIARITVVVEASLALVLFARFWQGGYEDGPVSSAYSAVFHSVASFNNAGISLYSDNLARFVGDPFVTLPVTASFTVGGLGFPLLVELWRRRPGRVGAAQRRARPRDGGSNGARGHGGRRRSIAGVAEPTRAQPWSLHARMTLTATGVLLVIGPAMVCALEWSNPDTLGDLDVGGKLLAGWFQGVTPRTAGFNTVPIGAMNETTLFGTTVLMFIGAGPASTSGGIKVTTAAVLCAVIYAEVRGDRDVNIFRRRIPPSMVRASLTILLLSVGLVVGTSLVLMAAEGIELTAALFESASAFGTVGLSTGVTGSLGTAGHLVLVVVMFFGRVGPVTFATAIALRSDLRLYRHPEERPIIG